MLTKFIIHDYGVKYIFCSKIYINLKKHLSIPFRAYLKFKSSEP
jgi:hypothetical protein